MDALVSDGEGNGGGGRSVVEEDAENMVDVFHFGNLSYKPLNSHELAPGMDRFDMSLKQAFVDDDFTIEQYVASVEDFSSQYGSDYSITYTALNIIGRPMKYPNYGDFPETFAMRTYGDWWNKAPSAVEEIQPQNFPKVPADDFIVLTFENYVLPHEISIFETYNPGSVLRIWAYTIVRTWVLLWEANPRLFHDKHEFDSLNMKCSSRLVPLLKSTHFPTKTIRIEFNHKYLDYFTELDAVLLIGRNCNLRNAKQILDLYEQQRKGSIVRKLQSMQFRPIVKENRARLQEFLMNDLNKYIKDILFSDEASSDDSSDNQEVSKVPNGQRAKQPHRRRPIGLKDMPFDILLDIFKFLDLKSLFRVGQVSRLFYEVSTHPLLYCELNLKPYWNVTSNEVLSTLAKRATVLKKFDLSWCGLFNAISPTEFKKFIQQRGDTLTHLRLNSCKFLNASCIETIGLVCDNLKELSLRNASTDIPLRNFSCLANLKHLERLDLFQSGIETDLLLTMLENNPKLKHLNLAFCNVNVNMDEVAQHLGTFNLQLVSLDMWKSHFLSTGGLRALANCLDLEEVDFGWCLREAALDDSLHTLLSNCRKMRKLFLATVRGITDRDVEDIANLCSNLEQLDLMGVLGIAKERYYEILYKCKKLKLLDLSFCDNIDEDDVALWSRTFNVHIKCNPTASNNEFLNEEY